MGFAMPIMGGMGWRWYDDGTVGGAPWWGLGTGLGWLAVLGSIAYVVYRRLVTAGTEQRPDAALAELRLASARGDLTDDEFEARRAVLERDAQA